MDYVSGLFCAANYCACVARADDLDEIDDLKIAGYAVSRLKADSTTGRSGCVTRS